jgi:hypothetical protein
MYTLSDQCDLQLVFQAKDALENLREAGFLHFIVLDDHDMIWYLTTFSPSCRVHVCVCGACLIG